MHIVVTYQATPAEISRGLQRAKRGTRVFFVLAMGISLLLSVVYFAERRVSAGVGFATMAACYAYFRFFAQRLAVKKYAYRLCLLNKVTLTDDFFGVENDLVRSEVKWHSFVKMEETPEFFLLFEHKRVIVVLPKRAFTADQAAEFSAYIASRAAR